MDGTPSPPKPVSASKTGECASLPCRISIGGRRKGEVCVHVIWTGI